MADESRDLILANFQAASGIEEVEICISLLEENNWHLETALTCFFSQQESQPNTQPVQQSSHDNSNYPVINLDPEPIDVDTYNVQSTYRENKTLSFEINWLNKSISVNMCETETVLSLKRILEMRCGMQYKDIRLEGWPNGDAKTTDTSVLSSLNLQQTTYLILSIPPKVTVSPAEFVPHNIDLAIERTIDVVAINNEDHTNQCEITLNVHHNQRDYKLRYFAKQTVKDVKQELFILTKITTKNQVWTGWPDSATDQSCLGDLELSQPDHFLMVTSQSSPSTSNSSRNDKVQKPSDSGTAGSPEDTDLDEQFNSDNDDDEDMFDIEANHTKQILPLVNRDSVDNTQSLINFQLQFEVRYGEFHPAFYMGSLKDAIEESAGQSAMHRFPLLIYLHHDKSILVNIFCSQILCSREFVSFVSENFITWAWDMTFESNKLRFINLLVQHFGHTAANTLSKYRDSEYPLLLVVAKSKYALEVCSMLQGNQSLDQLMSQLLNSYEVFLQTKNIEAKAEEERNARFAMKQEQDAAFYESLAADKAKAQAEQDRAVEEVLQQEQEKQEAQIKEAQRLSCIEQLPDEPPPGANNITKILFRFPNGDRQARRFLSADKLEVLVLYVASKGYNMSQHRMVTNFPRRQLSEESFGKTLKELKLCPQESVFVEEV